MTFVDTNVIMYAVGRDHPLRQEARAFFEDALESGEALVTSAEVLQELLHAYLAPARLDTLDSALSLVRARIPTVWSMDSDDVELARVLVDRHPGLGARDLIHLACCMRRDVTRVATFDRALAAAFA